MLFEGLMQENYKPYIALKQKYWSREHMFWDTLVVGIGFPVWMGLNQAQTWDKYPDYTIFCLWHFKEDYTVEYMAACVVLLTMTHQLKSVVSKHGELLLITRSHVHGLHMNSSDQLSSGRFL
ncbi:hypothetical protein DSO57_1005628 [Entomophthora muscae]|uniref:Uncharacterized protein n=1 Tax=Entomophthora muscae TaxID=34485 RepID=A0ACC2S9Z8_9FUNG|nr:hypothetical protein DSO57_1005628 [Entomophthora muscae]